MPVRSLADRLKDRTVPAGSLTNTVYAASPVSGGSELQRVLALPQRTWSDKQAQALADKWTGLLRRPNGTMRLRPIQGVALEEVNLYGGLLGPIPVGEGKTLIALLSFMVPGPKGVPITSGMLLLPPQLKHSLLTLTYPVLAANFRVPNILGGAVLYPDVKCDLDVLAYSQVSSKRQSRLLDQRRPQRVVCDEAHTVAEEYTARTIRFDRFEDANPNTEWIFLSGTLVDPKNMAKLGRLGRIALRERSPMPRDERELKAWADALHPNTFASPGELVNLTKGGPAGETVREAFGRRLKQTPGVVTSNTPGIPNALELHKRELQIPAEFQKVLAHCRKLWVMPNGDTPVVDEVGEEVNDALSFHRLMRQLACGFYYRMNPPAPRYWLDARRAYRGWVRTFLQTRAAPDLDSAGLIEEALEQKRLRAPEYDEWMDVKDTFTPKVETVWLTDYMVRDAVEFGRVHSGSIIWCEHKALAEAIAHAGGWVNYGGGEDAGVAFETESGRSTVVASVDAHGTGRNLQMFNTQLVTTPSSSAKRMEQLLGRCHRTGQQADVVSVWLYQHMPELRKALEAAIREATATDATGGGRQKLLSATYTFTNAVNP